MLQCMLQCSWHRSLCSKYRRLHDIAFNLLSKYMPRCAGDIAGWKQPPPCPNVSQRADIDQTTEKYRPPCRHWLMLECFDRLQTRLSCRVTVCSLRPERSRPGRGCGSRGSFLTCLRLPLLVSSREAPVSVLSIYRSLCLRATCLPVSYTRGPPHEALWRGPNLLKRASWNGRVESHQHVTSIWRIPRAVSCVQLLGVQSFLALTPCRQHM